MKREQGLRPEECTVGLRVLYSPSPGYAFEGVVAEEPWQLGGGTWVTHLRDMEPAYGSYRGTPDRTYVKAAALHALRAKEQRS